MFRIFVMLYPFIAFALFIEIFQSLTPEEYRRKDFSEFYVGCYWTLRMKNGFCDQSGQCVQADIQAADLQERFFAFYENAGPPPIEATQWLLSVGDSELFETSNICPGLVLTAIVFDATLRLPIDGEAAALSKFHRAESLRTSLDEVTLDTAYRMFPLHLAYDRFQNDLAKYRSVLSTPSTYVITRCRNSLDWLRNITIPANAHLHVYEKCNNPIANDEVDFINSAFSIFTDHQYTLDTQDGLMTGECAGYLQYIVDFYHELPDYVVFLHDDAFRHLKIPFLKILGKALANGGLNLSFSGLTASPVDLIHLNYYRVASLNTPCMRKVYENVFNETLSARLSTYCCGQFLVHKTAIRRRSKEFYINLLLRLRSNWDNVCSLGNMPCYVLEFLWQKIWRDTPMLVNRINDVTLPIFARHDFPDVAKEDYSLWFASQSSWKGQ
jgi:hypothetical protein